MTFLALWNKLGKKKPSTNTSNKVVLGAAVGDLKRLCEGRPDWEILSIPLALKSGVRGVKGKDEAMWLVIDRKEAQC